MRKLRLFVASFIVTLSLLITLIYTHRAKQPASPDLKPVAKQLFVTSQLTAENVLALERQDFQSIVDLRPDGEAADQAPSSEIRAAAEQSGLSFHYIPVPHGDIPSSAVDQLKLALGDQTKKTVLYCRSGNRAVRTFALVEASQADGRSCEDIVKMVHDAGFSADDLKNNINERIAKRSNSQEMKP